MKRYVITAVLLAAGATAANAYGTSTREIDSRQHRQESRIEQGLRNGSITRAEAARLKAEQERIQRLESAAKRDGYINAYERAQIDRVQDEASRHIRSESHDGEGRNWRRWWGGPRFGWGPSRWW